MSQLFEWIGNILIVIGLLSMVTGIFGIFRFKDYYLRMLVSANAETTGLIIVLFGIMAKQGFDFFTAKIFLVILLYITTTPIATHAVTRSAYRSGYRIKKERQ